jgi:hypothetical protein
MSMRIAVIFGLAALVGAAQAQASGLQLTPGLWRSKIRIAIAPNSKLPPAMLARLSQEKIRQKCITPAMAARASAEHFGADHALEQRSCARSGSGFAAGRVDQTVICHPKDGGVVNVHMTGNYTPVSTHLVTDISGSGKHMMMQKMTVDSQRIGDCPK